MTNDNDNEKTPARAEAEEAELGAPGAVPVEQVDGEGAELQLRTFADEGLCVYVVGGDTQTVLVMTPTQAHQMAEKLQDVAKRCEAARAAIEGKA